MGSDDGELHLGLTGPNPFGDTVEPVETKKVATRGDTAMRHARAIVNQLYPNLPPPLEASKKIVWTPQNVCDKCGRGLTPRSMGEDIYHCFDLFVVGFRERGALIQVTTERESTGGGGPVAYRKKKILEWVERYPRAFVLNSHSPEILIWSWKRRSFMKVWVLKKSDGWVYAGQHPSPLLNPGKRRSRRESGAGSPRLPL